MRIQTTQNQHIPHTIPYGSSGKGFSVSHPPLSYESQLRESHLLSPRRCTCWGFSGSEFRSEPGSRYLLFQTSYELEGVLGGRSGSKALCVAGYSSVEFLRVECAAHSDNACGVMKLGSIFTQMRTISYQREDVFSNKGVDTSGKTQTDCVPNVPNTTRGTGYKRSENNKETRRENKELTC